MAGKSVQGVTHDHCLIVLPYARSQEEVGQLSDDGQDGEHVSTNEDEEGALDYDEVHLLSLPPSQTVGGSATCGVEARLDVVQEAEGAKPLESVEEREERGPIHLRKRTDDKRNETEEEEWAECELIKGR